MKGKLIKILSHNQDFLEYWLYCEELEYELSPMAKTGVGHGLRKLSLKNCQAIEHGYDLEELADESVEHIINIYGERITSRVSEIDQEKGFKKGFKKALEILGDKKFSHGQLLNAMDLVWQWMNGEEYGCETLTEVQDKHIQSLQQIECDVEIEMEEKVYDGPQYVKKPKLDADGCLILKRK